MLHYSTIKQSKEYQKNLITVKYKPDIKNVVPPYHPGKCGNNECNL